MEFSGEDFSLGPLDTFSEEPAETKKKGGRPTIGDNFLLGSRNHWRSFFEQCWPEVRGPLSQIRKHRNSTTKDVRSVFERVEGKPHCDLARAFLRGEPQEVTVSVLQKQRIASNELRSELQVMRNKLQELQRSVAESENALKVAGAKDQEKIQMEFENRQKALRQHEEALSVKEPECTALEQAARAGETYLYGSELLDFLWSRRYALNPINLANALAGLPYMRWRQSVARCFTMREENYPQQPYALFRVIEILCKRISGKRGQSPVDMFRTALLKMPKSTGRGYEVDFLCERWRDLMLAIEEVSNAKPDSDSTPDAITSAFLRNVSRPKTSVDNVLDAQEKLTPKTKK